ncbi:MAG: DUF4402 domain-containing protein [Gammaproteobacteria bacterium]|nr:DUF4402 domain-containing protein [Gammaproteobacteria bacterium]
MKNTSIQLKVGALALMAGLYASSAVAETQTGVAQATVIEPLIIGVPAVMSFNTIAGSSTLGTIVMAAGGGLTATGGADIIGSTTGTSLTFAITGETGTAYTVTTNSPAVLSDGGGNTMSLALAAPTGDAGLSGGSDAIEVVGTLSLVANQVAGTYSTANGGGTVITITATYD